MFCLDGRGSFQRAGRVQGMGSILGKAQDNRERDRDCFACIRSKRPETGSLEQRATRDTQRMRNRYGDQTGPIRALHFCHVDPGAIVRPGLFPFAGLQHQEGSSGTNARTAPTPRARRALFARPWTAIASSRSHVRESISPSRIRHRVSLLSEENHP